MSAFRPALLLLCAALPAQQPKSELDRLPPDPLDGRPFVTAKAWAVADGKTGELLWGENADETLPMASTTKIMTALLVLRLADKDKDVLDGVVEVSRFAANTGGSTARLRPGDRIEVRDLLYGLLLPSGNDAANALAEHFGHRFAAPEDPRTIPWDPRSVGCRKEWSHFVAEMNRAAKELGLKHTVYLNPHGLDTKGHQSSARDILMLASRAMQNDLFRACVGTDKYQTHVIAEGGVRRPVEWKNTNRLLEIGGYAGIKTGTTSAAGACLVAASQRGDSELLLVVLNSTNRDGRYVDSRNLFRWAWNQRLAGGK